MPQTSHHTHICSFLKKHHVATLATVDFQGFPWCSNLFYAFDEQEMELIFTSDEATRHVRDFTENAAAVAASVVLDSKIVGKLQGIQITGVVKKADDERYKEQYLKRFPYAVFMLKELWVLRIDTAKYTDNRLGFGKKLYYER